MYRLIRAENVQRCIDLLERVTDEPGPYRGCTSVACRGARKSKKTAGDPLDSLAEHRPPQ